MQPATRKALISVSDKTGVVDFARGLLGLGFEILSTGGTAGVLKGARISVKEISDHTGFPEILNGRVKTLHPKIHGGILALRNKDHLNEIAKHGIETIDLVAVNLYPFEERIVRGCSFEEAIENIDIGGPALIRAAAKNHENVIVIVDSQDYKPILEELKSGGPSIELRRILAIKAYLHTAHYDAVISSYLHSKFGKGFPERLVLTCSKIQDMRYGENPHQKSAFYRIYGGMGSKEPSVVNALQLHGKALSYNNILDADCAIECVKEFERPACVIVKHATPCGIASADNISEAFRKAYETDTYSPYGGIVCFNRTLDKETSLELEKLFLEVVIAPSFELGAKEVLEKKKNLRLLEVPGLEKRASRGGEIIRGVVGGALIQDRDVMEIKPDTWKVVTKRQPTPEELKDMIFAVRCVRHIKSNAVVFVKNEKTVGIGGGQTARVDSSFIACHKGGERIKGSVMASEAFFPFRDAVDVAAEHGVVAVAQPGGSIRDQEVIDAANEHNIAMVFTGLRVFKH